MGKGINPIPGPCRRILPVFIAALPIEVGDAIIRFLLQAGFESRIRIIPALFSIGLASAMETVEESLQVLW